MLYILWLCQNHVLSPPITKSPRMFLPLAPPAHLSLSLDVSPLLIYAFSAKSFPLSAAFVTSQDLNWLFFFPFLECKIIFPSFRVLDPCVNLQRCWNSPSIFLFLISCLILYFMLSVLLNLFRCILWAQQWSFLVNVPCELEKRVFGCRVVCKWQLATFLNHPCLNQLIN